MPRPARQLFWILPVGVILLAVAIRQIVAPPTLGARIAGELTRAGIPLRRGLTILNYTPPAIVVRGNDIEVTVGRDVLLVPRDATLLSVALPAPPINGPDVTADAALAPYAGMTAAVTADTTTWTVHPEPHLAPRGTADTLPVQVLGVPLPVPRDATGLRVTPDPDLPLAITIETPAFTLTRTPAPLNPLRIALANDDALVRQLQAAFEAAGIPPLKARQALAAARQHLAALSDEALLQGALGSDVTQLVQQTTAQPIAEMVLLQRAADAVDAAAIIERAGRRVYVTTTSGDAADTTARRCHITCFDAAGRQVWTGAARSGVPREQLELVPLAWRTSGYER